MAKKSNPTDIYKHGSQSYRDLQKANKQQYVNAQNSEFARLAPMSSAYTRSSDFIYEGLERSPLMDRGDYWGNSMFDPNTVTEDDYQRLSDVRAENQPWYAQLGAGIAKGAILAGTTFLDGTIGLVVGGVNAALEGDFSKVWDNDFSKAMQAVNEASEQYLPNYYTEKEMNSPWWDNLFTANFIGDKFVKNLGFSIGALYSGGVVTAPLKAKGVASLINTIARTAKAAPMVSTAVGATIGAFNEARIEAINNSKDWSNTMIQKWDDNYLDNIAAKYETSLDSIDTKIQEAFRNGDEQKLKQLEAERIAVEKFIEDEYANRHNDPDYIKGMQKIAEDRTKMGNMDLLFNMPILMVSNIAQFARFYKRGFNTARRTTVGGGARKTAEDVAEDAVRYTGKKFSRPEVTWRVTKGIVSEGLEEISQKAASVSAGNYYETDVNNFYKAQIGRKDEQETLDWIKAIASGINETVNDASSWEEFFIGALTGALGIPTFRSIRNSDGSLRSPIKMEGGAWNEVKEYRKEIERSQEVANYLNSRVQSPEFLNYYRGLIRRNKYGNDMVKASEDNDKFAYDNAEHGQLVSDIVMFDNAGRLSDLKEYIKQAYDVSDENIESIIKNTQSQNEAGETISPFMDKKGNPMSNEEIAKKLTETKDNILNTIKGYEKIKNNLDIQTGGKLTDEQLSELTWMQSQIDNWNKRANDMTHVVREALVDLSNNLEGRLARAFSDASLEETSADETIDTISEIANAQGLGANRIKNLRELAKLSDKELAAILTSPQNVEYVESLITDLYIFGSDIISALDKRNVIKMLEDLPRLGKARETFGKKLEEYLANPEKQLEDQAAATESVNEEAQQEKNLTLKESLSRATTLPEFRDALSQETDVDTKENVLKDLENEGNEIARDYREVAQYDRELKRALNELGETDQVAQDALNLWQEQIDSAENVTQLANPNSVYVNNEDAFLEASEGDIDMAESRFQNARYALQRAMSKVNNDIKFKDRFSEEYKKPVDNPVVNKGIDKNETGDSGTPTVPYVNPNAAPVRTSPIPVGNVTAEMVADENSDANKRVETQRTFDQSQQGQRKYYRPAVPELHIEASKEGDFRPFDVVVSERERGVDFSGIYNYLRDNGAFSYVNAAKLKPGDTLGFMIDPEFNDHTIFLVDTKNNQIVGSIDESDASVARYEGLEELIKKVRDEYQASMTTTTIGLGRQALLREGIITEDGATGRIVHNSNDSADGSKLSPLQAKVVRKKAEAVLSNSASTTEDMMNAIISEAHHTKVALPDLHLLYKVQRAVQEGRISLEEAMDVIDSMLDQDNIKTVTVKKAPIGKFFATPQTRVSKMMVGRVPFTSEERSLADIPGVLDGDTKPVFGIIKNGVLTTNEKIDDRLVIKPVDMSRKEGRLYLLIPNAAGTYSPAAVRVKHFNTREFNLDDATVSNTPMGKSINEAIDKLSRAESQEDVSIAMKELASDIYMQDVMITWFDAKAGSGIVISRKIRKSDGTYETVSINGQEQVKETKYTVYYQNSKSEAVINGIGVTRKAIEEGIKNGINTPDQLAAFRQPKDIVEIRKDILNTILGFNLPIQVSTSRINSSKYNDRIINSNVLTSNLREAKVIGSWFTTDYFDNQGNLQQAISPSSVKPAPGRKTTTPVGGTESVVQGTSISIGGSSYTVDLKTMVYTDSKGVKHSATTSNMHIFAMAWAQQNFGDATESSRMTENKVITPQGRVLDRNTGTFVSDTEAKRIKDKIEGRNREIKDRTAKSKRVIADIYENQKKVDKARTSSDYYYILEEDGQYHEYLRVHSRLGDNWLGERTETENSRRALEAGTAVDKVIRDFFTSKETPVKPDTLSESAFSDLISKLTEIKSKMEQLGETFMADNIVLFQKYADGTRVAGEVDILSVDKNGNFKIYDVKTSRYSFSGRYFNEKSSKQRMSTKDYYTLQLSAYQNLFESQYGVRPAKLAILPFVLTYEKDKVASITGEKGILIDYNPAVNVPLASAVQAPQQQNTLPIFDSTMETMITEPKEQNRVLPENAFEEGGEIGYYEKDGKLYTGYLKKVGEIEVTYGSGQKDMVPIHLTKVRDRGFGREGEFGSTSEYLTVFPNGKAISTMTNDTNDNHAAKIIMEALSKNPSKVLALSSEKTQIHNPRELEELEAKIREEQYSPASTKPGGAASTIQREDAINHHDEEFEDELKLSEREKSPINYRGQEFILDDIPSMAGKHKSKVKAFLRIGYSLEQISNMIGENLLKLAGARGKIWDSLSREQRVAIAKGFNPTMTSFDSEYSEKGYSMNTEYQIEDIESLITSELYSSPLFQRILTIAKQFGVTVQFRNRAISDSAEGLYGYNKIAIQISPNSPYFEQVIVHELIHSVTQGLINREGTGELTSEQEVAVKILRGVFESIQGKYSKDSWYGLSNLAEFVAELANPKFREFLKSQEIEKGTSLWDKIKSFFKKLFGNKLELSDATLERMLENPVRDTDKVGVFQYRRERTIFNKDLSQTEKSFIQDFILGLNQEDRLPGRANIYNPNTGYYYTVNFSPTIEGHLDNLKEGRDGFEVMDRRKGLKSSMTSNWGRLDSTLQQALEAKGWTKEKFDSISQRERDQAVECVGL